jgi:hypothetical protein
MKDDVSTPSGNSTGPISGKKSASEGRKCGAPTSDGSSCQHPAGARTDHPGWGHCWLHFGRTENHSIAAEVERQEHEARSLLARLGEPTAAGPAVDVVVRGLDEAETWLAITRENLDRVRSLSTFDNFGRETERAAVLIYERALERRQRFAGEMIRYDLDRRRVEFEEAKAALVAHVITNVLTRAGVDAQAIEVRSWVAQELEQASRKETIR